MTIGWLLHARLICLAGAQIEHDLVVTEVTGRLKRKIFVAIFVRQTKRHLTFKNQIQLTEMLEALNNSLVSDKDTAIQLRYKESEEFRARLQQVSLLALIAEDVIKVSYHRWEKLLDKLIAQSGFKLH